MSDDKYEHKRLLEMIELLWDLGYVIVAAAGNNGPGPKSISTPGDCKKIITVGADNDNFRMIVNGKISYNYSGRGPTKQCINKPDIVAPANGIFSCCNRWKDFYYYVAKSGTSMATPIVTGCICLMLSDYTLTNVMCKKIIKITADDMKMDINRQGNGKINIIKALNYCKNIKR
jgi:serine protease AprX